MKHSISILTTITLFAVLILSACDSPDNQMQDAETSVVEAKRDMETAKNEVESEVRIYRAENAELIKENNRKINEIEQRIESETNEEVKAELEMKLEEVQETHDELKREMDNYKASGRDNWDNFKDSFTSKMDDLGDSIENFFSDNDITSSTN